MKLFNIITSSLKCGIITQRVISFIIGAATVTSMCLVAHDIDNHNAFNLIIGWIQIFPIWFIPLAIAIKLIFK